MNKKYITLLIVMLIVLATGVTLAYFNSDVYNYESDSTIIVSGGRLGIHYSDASGQDIILDHAIPGDSITKKFTITGNNNTDELMWYKFGLFVEENTFSEGALTYSLSVDSTSDSEGKLQRAFTNEKVGRAGSIGWLSGNFPANASDVKHVYNMTVSFPNDPNRRQDEDQGKIFSGYIRLEGEKTGLDFATDDWERIVANIDSPAYQVGDTRVIEIDENGNGKIDTNEKYTVRLANKTECNEELQSESACGRYLFLQRDYWAFDGLCTHVHRNSSFLGRRGEHRSSYGARILPDDRDSING